MEVLWFEQLYHVDTFELTYRLDCWRLLFLDVNLLIARFNSCRLPNSPLSLYGVFPYETPGIIGLGLKVLRSVSDWFVCFVLSLSVRTRTWGKISLFDDRSLQYHFDLSSILDLQLIFNDRSSLWNDWLRTIWLFLCCADLALSEPWALWYFIRTARTPSGIVVQWDLGLLNHSVDARKYPKFL